MPNSVETSPLLSCHYLESATILETFKPAEEYCVKARLEVDRLELIAGAHVGEQFLANLTALHIDKEEGWIRTLCVGLEISIDVNGDCAGTSND